MLVPMYVDRIAGGSVSPTAEGRRRSDAGSAIVIDAGNALGQLTARQAVKLVVQRARALGLASVAVRNAFHFGTAGRYARMIAGAGLRRHRDVEHAAADAARRAAPRRDRQQSDRDRAAGRRASFRSRSTWR